MLLWETFLEDYKMEISRFPLKTILEMFWHYCQDGDNSIKDWKNQKVKGKQSQPEQLVSLQMEELKK